MKKIFAFLTIAAILFAACEEITNGGEGNNGGGDNNGNNTTDGPQIVLKSNENITVGNGNVMGFISYTLINPEEGLTVEATANVDWIGEFSYKDMGKVGYKVEKNPNIEPRTGVVTITYGEQAVSVNLTQEGNPEPTNIVVDVPILTGHYYGNVQGLYNFYLVFSDKGMSSYEAILNHNYFNVPNAYYYVVDLYLTTAASNAECTVPNGTYGFDRNSNGWPDQFGHKFSWLQINDEGGFAASQTLFETGTLTVEDGKVTLSVTMNNKAQEVESHTVVFEGDYSLVDMSGLSYM
ncbi:MAG: BACON domain-containing protein [Alistipes sp.]|nr:BACON domain-containing protein [Alistipes sp.]